MAPDELEWLALLEPTPGGTLTGDVMAYSSCRLNPMGSPYCSCKLTRGRRAACDLKLKAEGLFVAE